MSREDALRIAEQIKHQYSKVKVLDDDVVIAIAPQIFTTSIVVDCEPTGYAYRYCFKHASTAFREFVSMKKSTDIPTGFIKRKPELN